MTSEKLINQVFVSYSHADREFFARLRVHLRPFERATQVEAWSDAKIAAGQDWRAEIRKALGRAAAAILLVSADFLASDFIAENELPPLLAAAKERGVTILPVLLKPCAFSDICELEAFQCVNDPSHPLISLSETEQEQLWYNVTVAARDALQQRVIQTSVPQVVEPEWDDMRESEVRGPDLNVLPDDALAFFQRELKQPESARDLLVYQYHFLDSLVYMQEASRTLCGHPNGEALITQVKKRLRSAGWEGDGVLQLLWLPPFVGTGVEDTWGTCVWHVKQRNNGTSWLASPVPLEFPRLQEQNE